MVTTATIPEIESKVKSDIAITKIDINGQKKIGEKIPAKKKYVVLASWPSSLFSAM